MYPKVANKLPLTSLYYMKDIFTCFSALKAIITALRMALFVFLNLVVGYLPTPPGILYLLSQVTLTYSPILVQVTP
jgi:hypothetical protein